MIISQKRGNGYSKKEFIDYNRQWSEKGGAYEKNS